MAEKEPIEIAKRIVAESGNTFHYKIVKTLRDKSWTVLVSPFYNDTSTDKPREIDIIAESESDVHSFGGHQWHGTINPKLFIECKYIKDEVVFWIDKKDRNKAIDRVMRDTGLGHPDRNKTINTHHYLLDSENVAKLFSSKPDKFQDNEPIYKAINQCLNATVYHRYSSPSLIVNPRGQREIIRTLTYPIIVCNSFEKFYFIDVNDEKQGPQKLINNFQIEVNYTYIDQDKNHRDEYFIIDVVSFDQIDSFLKKVETDISIVSQNHIFSQRN